MRPSRWTRRRRSTKAGCGGYYARSYGVGYIDPVSGDGIHYDWWNVGVRPGYVLRTWRRWRRQLDSRRPL